MRRAWRVSAWFVGAAMLLVLSFVGLLLIAGNTDPGRTLLEKLTHRLTSGQVSLSGLNGAFPQRIAVQHVELRDERGVWLTADGVELEWSPLALLARRVQIDALHAARVDMQRLPEPSSKAPGGAGSMPRIDVVKLTVDLLQLGAQLAGSPASLVLKGSAHLRSAEDVLIDASARRIDGDGEYAVHLRSDSKRMDADLNLHEPAGGPLENLLQLPGLGAVSASVRLGGPRAAERLEVSVEAGASRGRARGTLNLDAMSADLDFALDSPALAPRADLAWQRASVHGRWQGGVSAPHADAHIEVEQLCLPGGAQVAALHGDVTADSGIAALHALIGGLRVPGLQPQLLQDAPIRIDASMRLDIATRPLDLTASHRLFSLRASTESAAFSAGHGSVALELRLPNLGEFAALGGPEVRGSALVKAQVRNDGPALRLLLDANAALRAGTQIWSEAVGESPVLQLSGALTDGAIAVDNMKLTGRAISLTGSGEVSRAARGSEDRRTAILHARWKLGASDLKAFSPSLVGTLNASGALDGPLTAFGGEAQLSSTLSVHNSPTNTLFATAKMRGLPSAPNGTFSAQGILDGAPLHVEVAVERAPAGSSRALIQRAEWKSAQAQGDITIARAVSQSHGQVRLQIGQLADLRNLLEANIAGSLAGTLALRADRGRTLAELRVEARNVAAGKLVGNAQLTAEGVTDSAGFKLDVQIPDLRGARASLTAAGTLDLGARKVSLVSAAADYHGENVRLLSPARFAFANGMSVDELRVGAQQAILQIKGDFSPTLDVSASLNGVKPSLINLFAPGLMSSGTVEARAKLRGSLASPTGEVGLTATGMRMADDAAFGLPALDLRATAKLRGDTADVDAQFAAGTASQLSVVGRAPLAAEGAWNLKIAGAIDVGMINPFLEARGQHAAGQLSVDASVAGSVAEPQIAGTVNLTKGSVRDYGRGLSLTDINAAIVGSEGTLEIKSLMATAAPGTVSMTGKIGVLQAGVPIELHIKADNAQPLVSKLVTANLDADLKVNGKARQRLDIAGTVRLHRTLIGIPNSLPPNVAVLDVRRRGKAAAVAVDKPLVIGLDVAVHAPQEILVQGRGLDAEMGGDLRVTGTTESPAVTGGFDLQRGTFSISGNKLNFLPESRMSFNGAGLKNKIDPTLDFTARTAMSDSTVTLRITGLADAPQFEFTSTPVLPQDEILARLLFGQNVAQLSALQVAQIGVALATLSGVGGDGGLNPLVKIQKSLGLDRLTVGAGSTSAGPGTENTGASIAAGRYISKRVYVEAKQTTLGTSQLETDIDLTKHLKLQTRIGNGTASVQGTTPENDPGSSVGLVYQIEY
ncbi:MAG: translocation/assembly module TamB domain-containing protein [Pseudomonadota bacterium]|nr:translocation/assembly module TamB domain-containing protein [Pseudomonadota bacterium]